MDKMLDKLAEELYKIHETASEEEIKDILETLYEEGLLNEVELEERFMDE